MVISLKDGVKLIGISVICFCAVFVCTFFINYYIDASAVAPNVTEGMKAVYEGQLATAKISCALSGCCLTVIAFFMLAFYVKLYVDGHSRQLGILKAMGYSDRELALRFWVFGLSVFIGAVLGCGAGYAAMPLVYGQMTVEGLEIPVKFHFWLPLLLISVPTVIFSLFSCGYAYLALKRPVSCLLKCKTERNRFKIKKSKPSRNGKEHSFLMEMCLKTLSGKKMLAFFIAFASFCFSAMIQMGGAMYDLNSGAMGPMILIIGIVLASTTMFIAMTALINSNIKNIAIMKAFGYSVKECASALFTGYVPCALIGFGIGTGYQFLILRSMVDLFFKEYSLKFDFNVSVFFITLAAFAVFYAAAVLFYVLKMKNISVKEVAEEN